MIFVWVLLHRIDLEKEKADQVAYLARKGEVAEKYNYNKWCNIRGLGSPFKGTNVRKLGKRVELKVNRTIGNQIGFH